MNSGCALKKKPILCKPSVHTAHDPHEVFISEASVQLRIQSAALASIPHVQPGVQPQS